MSPNAERGDVILALLLALWPLRYRRGTAPRVLEDEFSERFQFQGAVSFDSGRSALLAVLTALDIGKDDEVIVSAYTCNVVPNAVLYRGAVPKYADIDEATYNIDPASVEKLITSKTKAIIVQHTFGVPADIHALFAVARKYNLKVIEDCAHALSVKYHGKFLGSFGDAAIFSFGRDKVISSVHGGMAVATDPSVLARIREVQEGLKVPSNASVLRNLMHPIFMKMFLPWYRFGVGKVFLYFLKRVGLLSRVMEPCEKKAIRPAHHPLRMPNALAKLARYQLSKLEKFTAHRRLMTSVYQKEFASGGNIQLPRISSDSPCLMYTVLSDDAPALRKAAKREGVLLGSWWGSPVVPFDCDLKALGYRSGLCPVAERVSARALNLPTGIRVSESDAIRISRIITEK